MTDVTEAFFAGIAGIDDPALRQATGTVCFELSHDDGLEHWLLVIDKGTVRAFRAPEFIESESALRGSKVLFEQSRAARRTPPRRWWGRVDAGHGAADRARVTRPGVRLRPPRRRRPAAPTPDEPRRSHGFGQRRPCAGRRAGSDRRTAHEARRSGRSSSANTGPMHAPITMMTAVPVSHVTSASATPKKPNWRWFSATVRGIQSPAETVYAIEARPVTMPVGRRARRRTSRCSMNHGVIHHTPIDAASREERERRRCRASAENVAGAAEQREVRDDPDEPRGPECVTGDATALRASPRARVDALQRSRKRVDVEERQHQSDDPSCLAHVVRRRRTHPSRCRGPARSGPPGA